MCTILNCWSTPLRGETIKNLRVINNSGICTGGGKSRFTYILVVIIRLSFSQLYLNIVCQHTAARAPQCGKNMCCYVLHEIYLNVSSSAIMEVGTFWPCDG